MGDLGLLLFNYLLYAALIACGGLVVVGPIVLIGKRWTPLKTPLPALGLLRASYNLPIIGTLICVVIMRYTEYNSLSPAAVRDQQSALLTLGMLSLPVGLLLLYLGTAADVLIGSPNRRRVIQAWLGWAALATFVMALIDTH